MELTRVKVHQFLSVEDEEISFDGDGLSLVLGTVHGSSAAESNGAGKSALFVEPLHWALFDCLVRANQRFKKGVKRRYRGSPVADDTWVEVQFSHRDKEYRVRRSLKNDYLIQIDGHDETPYGANDGRDKIKSILGLPAKLFQAIAVMGQGFPSRFSGFDDQNRSKIIEDFIESQVYLDAESRAAALRGETEKKAAENRGNQEEAKNAVFKSAEHVTELEKKLDQVKKGRAEALQGLTEELKRKKEGLKRLGKESAQNDTKLIDEQLERIKDQAAEFDERASHEGNLLAVAEAEVERLKNQREALNGLSDCCPTCRQAVSAEIIRGLMGQCQIDLEKQKGVIGYLKRLQSVAGKKKNDLAGTVKCIETERNRLVEKNEPILKMIGSIEGEINTLTRAIHEPPADMQVLEGEVNSAKGQLQQQGERTDRLVGRGVELRRASEYLAWWEKGFSVKGIRNLRLGDILETLNSYLLDYCQALFDGEIQVRLAPEKQQKTTKAKPVVAIEVDGPAGCYDLSSGGQCRKIDLAIHLALRRLAREVSHGWSCNILIADEVLDHLDQTSAQRVLNVLRDEEDIRRVFIISHDPALQSLCDDVIQVHYRDETSRLLLPRAGG